jgi:hypothetical protein
MSDHTFLTEDVDSVLVWEEHLLSWFCAAISAKGLAERDQGEA